MSQQTEVLIRQLSSTDTAEPAAAAEALARRGHAAQPAAAALVAALRTPDPSTRDWATATLEELGPPPAGQIPELTRLAEDNSLDTAYWAITLLGRAGAAAASAAPTLANLLQSSPEIAVRECAAWALGKLGAAAASALPALRAAAASTEPRLSRLARQALDAVDG
jgi:HEAT repeat protein